MLEVYSSPTLTPLAFIAGTSERTSRALPAQCSALRASSGARDRAGGVITVPDVGAASVEKLKSAV
ncbi:hypothetical protein [Nostoc sp.]|uniref:hypothetical protein n=1 Tax=Nostoc sp. TaxID=1180 RepID=UPI002FF473F4